MSELNREGKTPADIAPNGLVVMDGSLPYKIKAPCTYCKQMLTELGVQPGQIRTE